MMLEQMEIEGGCQKCGCPEGYLKMHDSGLHIGLYCSRCAQLQRWVSKRDAGVAPRSMASRSGITPSVRHRVLARDGHRCVMCGATPPSVHLVLGHIVSVFDANKFGLTDQQVNSFWNLCCMCEECNAGLGKDSMPLPTALRVFHQALLSDETEKAAS